MTLITVLAVLWLDNLLETHRESRLARAIGPLAETLALRVPADRGGFGWALVVVLPPALVLGAVQWLVGGWLYGLVGLVLAIVVVLWSLGPLDVIDILEDYIEARRAEDTERSDWFYQRFTGETVPAQVEEEGRGMVDAVLYQTHDHVFATLFWFCVLGPAGALLYRTTAEAALHPLPGIVARPELQRSLRFVLGLLGWIPTRLMALGYVITGSFNHAAGRLRTGFVAHGDWVTANHWLLMHVGAAALRGDDGLLRSDEAEIADGGERRSPWPAEAADGARRLVLRTVVLWLAVLALLTLVGWIA